MIKKKRKLVCGIGVNDADYAVHPWVGNKRVWCPYYKQWSSIINGNYSKKAIKLKTNCIVVKEWHYFMCFRKWMKIQDWKGKSLDKDIIVPGNKVYGPEVCAFVPQAVNNIFLDRKKRELPMGVYYNGVYYINVKMSKSTERIRSKYIKCNTIREASDIWLEYKEKAVIETCATLTDSRVIKGLMLHMELLKQESLRRIESKENNEFRVKTGS